MGCKVLPLLLLLLLRLAYSSLATSHHLYKQRILDMRSSIVEALGLTGIPDIAKANVSQAEYERAHNEYLTKLQQSGSGHQRSLFTLRPSGIEAIATGAARGSSANLTFPLLDWGQDQVGAHCSVESALLRLLLQHREPDSDSLELEVRLYDERTGARLLSRGSLRDLGPNQPRWLQLELPPEVILQQRQLRLLAQLLLARPNKSKSLQRLARGLSVSEAALNLQLACGPRGAVPRTRRSARRPVGPEQLWSVHKGRRTECKATASAKKCCRHEMSVNFKDLEGFDFIVQPKSFDAGFCKGRCPPRYNPAHHHALLQSLIWKGDRSKAPRPCCAPSKLAELEILYFDENEPTKLKVSNWKDMRVLECACS